MRLFTSAHSVARSHQGVRRFFNELRRCYGAVTQGERERARRRLGEVAKNDCRNGFDAHNSGNVEIISADMQNKPDVGVSIANAWFDTNKVDVI